MGEIMVDAYFWLRDKLKAGTAGTKALLLHLTTSNEFRERTLDLRSIEYLGPRGSKGKVLKIKRNRPRMRC